MTFFSVYNFHMNQQLLEQLQQMRMSTPRKLAKQVNVIARYFNDQIIQKWKTGGYEDVNFGHIALLANIDVDGINNNALARKAWISKQAMSKVAQELESGGYITTRRDPNDARSKLIELTEKGVSFMIFHHHCVKEMETSFTLVLGRERMRQYMEINEELMNYILEDVGYHK